jgi:hypothetical protein
MRAMIVKEFRQLRRDRRTLAMMILMPVLLLVILGYAASFDVSVIPTVVAGPGAATAASSLPASFKLAGRYPAAVGGVIPSTPSTWPAMSSATGTPPSPSSPGPGRIR